MGLGSEIVLDGHFSLLRGLSKRQLLVPGFRWIPLHGADLALWSSIALNAGVHVPMSPAVS